MKRTFSVLFVLALTVTAVSCSKNKSTTASAHNDADVMFAQDMIPHHQQAVEMAGMALEQTKNPQVVDLARRIKKAQDPEMMQMRGFLKDWGKSAMGNEDHGMSGMMSAADMKRLGTARDAAFDKLFLQMMTMHHQGAVKMAQTEQADGKSTPAKKLAAAIIEAQNKEIAEMKQLSRA